MSIIGVKEFQGKIGLSYSDSKPWWPGPIRAPRGAPNVLYIVLDDVGFGHLGCYGGEVETPNIDALAEGGLRYTQFHTTALCSPTRSCLMTGRNHHSNHMACISESTSGFPGYDAMIPKENGTIAEYLKMRGYSTYALGKWHLTPADEESWAGPYDHWPLGMGFEHFYGFLGAEANQYYPDLVQDNHPVKPPKIPEEGYHLMGDLTDRAIEYISNHLQVEPSRPFLMYFCPGACHAPHHAPREWIDKYKGRFDKGWDKVREEILVRQKSMGIVPPNTELAPHLPTFEGPSPTWDSLSSDQQRLFARMMEVFAAYLSYADHEIGRLLNFLKETELFENTLIVVISDNGASGEGGVVGSTNENKFLNNIPESLEENLKAMPELGGPKYYNHYPQGWALAGNTPFKFYKRYTYEGGVCDPLIVHWPKRIKARGELRNQYHHAVDVVPTILEALGFEAPSVYNGIPQRPIEGVSMAYSFNDPNVPTRKEMQYYEMMGSRAAWHNGWKAVTRHEPMSETGRFDEDVWELYHVDEDRSEIHDLSKQYPEKLEEMRIRWWVMATTFNVLPLDDRGISRIAASREKPTIVEKRSSFIYYPNTAEVPQGTAPVLQNISHAITAEVEIPEDGAEGVILSQGSQFGFSFFIKNKRLVYAYNYVGIAEYRIVSNVDVPTGKSKLRFEFEVTGKPDVAQGKGAPGVGRLLMDGKVVGEGQIPVTVPLGFSITGGGISCGRNEGQSVTSEYRSPFSFTGKIKQVTLDLGGEPSFDAKAELRRILATV